MFDCNGQIAAVISNVITQILQTFRTNANFDGMGTPNIVSVPVQQLVEASQAHKRQWTAYSTMSKPTRPRRKSISSVSGKRVTTFSFINSTSPIANYMPCCINQLPSSKKRKRILDLSERVRFRGITYGIAAFSFPAARPGISTYRRGLRRGGDRGAPCNSSPSLWAGNSKSCRHSHQTGLGHCRHCCAWR